jgi:RNA polymerase sigma factor (sigma-70 family)
MAVDSIKRVVQQIRDVAQGADARDTDADLLARFVSQRDASALGILIQRQAPMVWGVCWRVLGHRQDAEDAFQATFLVLLRRAAVIKPRGMVGNWLYGVAFQTALKARAMATKRTRRETPTALLPESSVPARDGHPLLAFLDEELQRLPDKYRAPLLLCDLQGKTRVESAQELGWAEGTVASRLARGRAMLAKRLARHGTVLSATAVSALLAGHVGAVPAPLLAATIQAASAIVAAKTTLAGGLSQHVVTLAEGVVKAMFLSKLKIAALMVLTVALLGGGVGALALSAGPDRAGAKDRLVAIQETKPRPGEGENAKVSNQHNKPEPKPAPPATNPPKADDAKKAFSISGRALDAVSGQPIPNVRVIPAGAEREDPDRITWQSQYLKEFKDGRFIYETDRPWDKTMLRIEADGYRPAMTRAVAKGEKAVVIDVKLERGVFAGVVLLPDGRPAVKADVAVASHTNEVTVRSAKLSYGGHGARLRKVVQTDEQGRFEVSAEIDPSMLVVAHDAGYAEMITIPPVTARGAQRVQPAVQAKPQDNRALKVTVRPWGRVEGRVMAGAKPVVGADYMVYQSRSDDLFVWTQENVKTDAEGRFVVERLPPGKHGICQRYVRNPKGEGSHVIHGVLGRFELSVGQTATLQLGSPGRTLVGRFALPEGLGRKLDWTKVSVRVSLQAPRFVGFGSDKAMTQSWVNFLQSEEGKHYRREKVAVAADGSFRIEGLPAAEYDLSVAVPGEA